jgi:hypothetical protein
MDLLMGLCRIEWDEWWGIDWGRGRLKRRLLMLMMLRDRRRIRVLLFVRWVRW